MRERRRDPRIGLNIHARGAIIIGPEEYFGLTSYVTDISKGGARLRLSEDSATRIKNLAVEKADLKGAGVDMRLISYVEDNIRITGSLAYLKNVGNDVYAGISFTNLDDEAAAALGRIMELQPDVEGKSKNGDAEKEEHHFKSFEDFFNNLTQYTILHEKEGAFYIGGERYMFIGMHISDSGEIHSDCIESVDSPGKVICPDCKTDIDPESLI